MKKIRKPVKKILEYYYMIPEETDVKRLSACLEAAGIEEEMIEIWVQLDLMEVILSADSLIFQNAAECFEHPEDLAFMAEHQIKTVYQISFDEQDKTAAGEILRQLLQEMGGLLCSDTEDFQPIYTKSEGIPF